MDKTTFYADTNYGVPQALPASRAVTRTRTFEAEVERQTVAAFGAPSTAVEGARIMAIRYRKVFEELAQQ